MKATTTSNNNGANNTPAFSIMEGCSVINKAMYMMLFEKPILFAWVMNMGAWIFGFSVVMLALGSSNSNNGTGAITAVTPILSMIALPIGATMAMLLTSKFGFTRILGYARCTPWLLPLGSSITEIITGSYKNELVDYGNLYTIYIFGHLIVNGISSILDIYDVYRWLAGERDEIINTGFFSNNNNVKNVAVADSTEGEDNVVVGGV